MERHPLLIHIGIALALLGTPGASPSFGSGAATEPAAHDPVKPAVAAAQPQTDAPSPQPQQQGAQPDGGGGSAVAGPLPLAPWFPDLPDAGPRYDRSPDGPVNSLFVQGLVAYARKAWPEAEASFRQLLEQNPDGPFPDEARAFLAELLVLGDSTAQRGQAAIDAYRRIIRDFPQTSNAERAYWRVGDLYVGLNMWVEAQAAYEQGAAVISAGADADRAWLGLAATYAAERRWPEAERILKRLIGQTADDDIRRYSMLALADLLHAEQQFQSAQPVFEAVERQWAEFLKGRPQSFLRAIDNARRTGRWDLVRRWSLLFYNLYPRSEQAPLALVEIGDVFHHEGASARAARFYAEAITRYPDTQGAGLGRVRLAELGLEQATGDAPHLIRSTVAALFRDGPTPNLDATQRGKALRNVADAEADDTSGSEALFRLGEHYEAVPDMPRALAAYRELVLRAGRVPDDPWPTTAGQRLSALLIPQLRDALKQANDLQAVTLFYQLWGSDEQIFADQETVLQAATVYRRIGFTAESVRLFQYLLRVSSEGPTREEALFHLGQAYLDQDDWAAARQVFERYRLQYPLGRWKADAMLQLAQVHRGLRNDETVVRILRRWLTLFPAHPAREEARMMLAQALADTGQSDGALRLYAEVERTGILARPTGVAALIQYADLLQASRRYDDAVTRYWQALRASPDAAQTDWIRIQLARVWRAQDHRPAARQLLKDLNRLTTDELLARLAASMQADLAATKTGGS
ncbi:MAG: tetratricopeptide repeat protein [Nitrospirota bacterium]|nr:tetratricopeptide repeat protein [Nitrospirota bacterium]